MPKGYSRSQRIAGQIRRELPGLLKEARDPRVSGLVTITDVTVSADYEHAKIYFTILGSEPESDAVAAGLNRASGFLRVELGHVMRLRAVPKLQFFYDKSVSEGARLSSLISEAVGSFDPDAAEREE